MVYYSSSEGSWVRVDEVEWDEGNLHHATLRVSAADIEQVIDDLASIWRVNRKGRTATHLVSGAGRPAGQPSG